MKHQIIQADFSVIFRRGTTTNWNSFTTTSNGCFRCLRKSGFNLSAPVLAPGDIKAFQSRPDLQGNLRQSFLRMLRFYDLELKSTEVVQSEESCMKAANWLSFGNIAAINALST
ncbi:MAG TPA: opioid growth factor receptor-related protein [Terriglobales bacterium]|nr:opioid growth factor receptor-related protein [Terriglobales bacterium]